AWGAWGSVVALTGFSFRLYGRPSMIFCEYASPMPDRVSSSALGALLMSTLAPSFLSSLAAGCDLAASALVSLAGGGAVFVCAMAGAQAAPGAKGRATGSGAVGFLASFS